VFVITPQPKYENKVIFYALIYFILGSLLLCVVWMNKGLGVKGYREPLQEQFDHCWTHLKLTNILFIIFISENLIPFAKCVNLIDWSKAHLQDP
jgi:hypothetical protein